jgi:thiosulfate dehydrogenase [quinone] large subunit
VGWAWLSSGWGKFNDPKWLESGVALQAFWERAVAIPETGRAPITYDWYRTFLETLLAGGHYTWFAKVVLFGEMAIGLALILGAFTGIAAFFGGFMNFNFMMAGTASTNPVLFVLAVLLVLAWKTAGYYGLDRWLLPALGTPWQPGEIFEQEQSPQVSRHPLSEPPV